MDDKVAVIEALQQAILTGEVLTICYHGGSSPGVARDISPVSVTADKVLARCYRTNQVKTFSISKVQIGLLGKKLQPPQQKPKYSSLQQAHEQQKTILEDLGWIIIRSKTHIGLHRRYKNGNLLKHSDVSIRFQKYTNEIFLDYELNPKDSARKKRVRPWVVRSKTQPTKTFAKIEPAITCWLEYAGQSAPKVQKPRANH